MAAATSQREEPQRCPLHALLQRSSSEHHTTYKQVQAISRRSMRALLVAQPRLGGRRTSMFTRPDTRQKRAHSEERHISYHTLLTGTGFVYRLSCLCSLTYSARNAHTSVFALMCSTIDSMSERPTCNTVLLCVRYRNRDRLPASWTVDASGALPARYILRAQPTGQR